MSVTDNLQHIKSPEIEIRVTLTQSPANPEHLLDCKVFSVPRIGEYIVISKTSMAYTVDNISYILDSEYYDIEVFVSNPIDQNDMRINIEQYALENTAKTCENKLD